MNFIKLNAIALDGTTIEPAIINLDNITFITLTKESDPDKTMIGFTNNMHIIIPYSIDEIMRIIWSNT